MKKAPPNWIYFQPGNIAPAIELYKQVHAVNADPRRADDIAIDLEPVPDVDKTMLSRRELKKLDSMTYSAEILVGSEPPPSVNCLFNFPESTGTDGWPGPRATEIFNSYGSAARVDMLEAENAEVSFELDADPATVIEFVIAVLEFHHDGPFADWRLWAREV